MTGATLPRAEPALGTRLAATGLVIFDFDGVVADSEVLSLATLRDTFRAHGLALTTDETRDRFLGTSLASITDYASRHVVPAPEPADFAAAWQSTLFDAFRAGLAPVPGLAALLDALEAAGIGWCIASSGTHERIGIALGAMGLAARFHHVFSAEDVARGKPAPDIFLHAAARMGAAPGACLVIEDSPFGVMAARAAGMACAGFLGGAHLDRIRSRHAAELRAAGAGWVLRRHADLIAALPGPG